MEPVMSPWVIYLIYQTDVFKTLLIVSGALGLTAVIVIRVIVACMKESVLKEYMNKRRSLYTRLSIKNLQKFIRKCLTISSIIFIIGVCAPNRNLLIVMMASKYITPNNLKAASETVGSVYKFGKEEFISLLDEIIKRVRDLNQNGVVKDNEKISRDKKEKAI